MSSALAFGKPNNFSLCKEPLIIHGWFLYFLSMISSAVISSSSEPQGSPKGVTYFPDVIWKILI